MVQARLRELPIIYILILGISIFWRRAVLGEEELTLYHVDAVVILASWGMMAFLWSPWPVPLAWLKAIELAMVGMIAGRVAIIQYRLMLDYLLRNDPMLAQLTMTNVVLKTSVLILTYGLYVPKSWRARRSWSGRLRTLPFFTLLVLPSRQAATSR